MNNYLLTNMDTIDKINYYLTKSKKTGADLCEFLGASSGVYSQWNTRRTKPRKGKLPAIAEFLGVSVADLLPDKDPSAGIKKTPSRRMGPKIAKPQNSAKFGVLRMKMSAVICSKWRVC